MRAIAKGMYTVFATTLLVLGSAQYAAACDTQCCCGFFACSSECAIADCEDGQKCRCDCSCTMCHCDCIKA